MDFNAEATNWDNEKRVKRAKIIGAEIAKAIEIKKQYHALEFGCGTGLVSFNLVDKFKHITLIDTSEGMIERVDFKINELKATNMKAICGDINDEAEIQGEKFHVIYTSMALHHIIDVKTTLKNLYEKLNDNGYLCIIELVEDDGSFHKSEKDFNGHNGFNQKELKKSLEELGFKNVTTNVFYNDIKVIEGEEINYSLFIMIGKK